VERAFRPGGQFSGALQESTMSVRDGGAQGRALFLKYGMGAYRLGDDVIKFGRGHTDHEVIDLFRAHLPAHGTVLRTAGSCVHITGYTPFRNDSYRRLPGACLRMIRAQARKLQGVGAFN